MTVWGHNELAEDLAQYLRSDKRMVWTDMQLGPSGSPRPDVYTIEKSYSRPMPIAYEIKVSRSDLRSDTTSGKWQKYLTYAGSVVFAVPDGLCTPADIPNGCGLIVRKDKVWRNIRRATRHDVALPMDAAMKLLIDGVGRTVGLSLPSPRKMVSWELHDGVRKKFGEAVAIAARDISAAQKMAKNLQSQRHEGFARVDREVAVHREYLMANVKSEMAQYEAAKRDLIEWMGLEDGAASYAIYRAIAALKASCDVDQRVQAAEHRLRTARTAIEGALRQFPAEPEPCSPPN